MPTTIESLELEVQSSSTSATSGIDALSASLSKLKNAVKGGVGLTSVANQLNNLNAALQGIDSSSAGKLDTLSNSLSKLSGLGNLKISSSIANQIRNLGTAATSLNGVDFSGISKLASSLQPLTTLGKSNLASFITQLGKLPQLAQTLNSMNIPQFTAQIQQLANALAPLANQLNTVATAFQRLPTNIRKTVTATNAMATANNTASTSYINLWAKCRMAMNVVKTGARTIGSWITQSNAYIENLNLFTASMGGYAAEAKKYAEQVGNLMGIDPGEWMRNQGIFMTITKGFGVASDRAYTMSQNLTQLGYDISSFFNISFEDSMQKLTSGISGELEPLRRLGYDLSVARLQQEAYSLGIDKSVQSMTQAEKSELRYYAIMTQVTTAQGDMARTLNAPANQLRVLQAQVTQCARALGNIFIPALNAILPYAIAVAKVIRMLADTIASFFGFELPKVDYSSISAGASAIGDMADSADDTAGGLGNATKAAKKLKNALLGIDELNVISKDDDFGGSGSGLGAGGAGGAGGGLGFDLPTYDFMGDLVSANVDKIMKKLEPMITWLKKNINEILAGAMAIGACFLAWTIAEGVLKAIEGLSTMKGFTKLFSIGFKVAGLGLFLDAWNTIKEAIEDIRKNEANFTNVTKLISGFAEGLGAAFLLLGKVKLGGAALVIAGVTGIVSDISDMCKNGVNWDNATSLVKNIGLFMTGIGLVFGNLKLGGIGLTISGVALIVQNFKALVKGFTTGDFEDVNWVEVAAGALMVIGGLILTFKKVNAIGGAGAELSQTSETIQSVTDATGSLDTAVGGGGGLTTKMTSLVKNLALGLVVIVEVAAAALLITGAIILLGMELEQVGIAWQPVITNAGTVAIAMGVGVVLLAAIGAVTALLGSVGTDLIVNLALGIAMLALIGVSAGLFIAEIWAVGKGLEQVGIAWQPVITNAGTVAIAMGVGVVLLAAIGAVTALLGSVGTDLIVNLALGIAMLALIGVSAGLFIAEIWAVGKGLEQVGIAWQPVLDNGKAIATAIAIGTGLLIGIGVVCALLGVAATGTGGMLPLAIGLGTAMLLELGVAAGLFIIEIWAIGKGLDEIGKAWQPVLDNGKTIATGIRLGTRLLIGIGVVTAALGVATVASAGLLPLAIGLGTALLVELSAAFIIFTESLVAVADELSENLSPSLSSLNEKLPTLSDDMSDFVDFMTEFAGNVVEYTEVSAIAGLSATIDTIIGWFTEDPIDKLADDVASIYSQTSGLNEQLNLAVPELNEASELLQDYQGFLAEIQSLTNSNVDLNNGQFANMETVGEKIVTGFVDGIESKSSDFSNTATTIVSGFTTQLTTSAATSKTSFTTWATNLKNWFTQSDYGAINSTTFEGYAKNVVTGFETGVTNNYSTSKSGVTTWADYIKKLFSDVSYGNVSKTQWETYAKNVVTGFSSGITSNYSTAKSSMTTFANCVKSWFEKPDGSNTLSSQFYNIGKNIIQGFIDGVNSLWDAAMERIKEFGEEVIKKGKEGTEEHSPSKAFRQIGSFVIEGFNIGIADMMGSSFKLMNEWTSGITAYNPQLALAVDTSALSNFNPRAIADDMYAQVQSNYNTAVAIDDSSMREVMREAMLQALNDSNMASDVKRQADKEEQTIVQVGNRTVTDAVTTQKKANGYVFAT